MKILQKEFYDRDAKVVAKEILGKLLIRKLKNNKLIGKIVETEGYYGAKDPASRARKSKILDELWKTARASTIFVYMVHGNCLLNIMMRRRAAQTLTQDLNFRGL